MERLALLARTIRGRLVLAFLAMSVITAALGAYATLHVQEVGGLAGKTYDQSLMSVSYARAASADFAAMQVMLARRPTAMSAAERSDIDRRIEDLRASLADDLSIAGQRSQSRRASQAAASAAAAVLAWDTARQALPSQTISDSDWADLDSCATTVNQQIDLLVNYTAGDGFLFRQSVRAITAGDIKANVFGTVLALLLSATVVWLLARRIIGPVAAASSVARQIARGQLDCVIPEGNGDELGALLTAMAVMRDNLRDMMDSEVAQRRSAQARLADALESSQEGIVVVDPAGRIALANAQVAAFLAMPPDRLQPGSPVSDLAATLDMPSFASGMGGGDRHHPLTRDVRLGGGRWLRVSQSATHDGGVVAVLSDLTLRKEQEERLKATNASLDAALENMSQGLCLYDAQGRLILVNSRFRAIFRLDPDQVLGGLTFEDVFQLQVAAGNYPDRTASELQEVREAHIAQKSDEILFEELAEDRTIAIAHRSTADGGWVATYEDVTERRSAEKQILFMARHDALTRLPNRTFFGERIEQALEQCGRGSGFAVLCLDLDRFKQVNDTLGHPVGDELLRYVAERLKACVGEGDTVARLGGDEFAVIQLGIERIEDTFALARRIVDALSGPIQIDGQTVSVGVSIGLAIAMEEGLSGTSLLKNADAALYRAKADGRGTWRCFEPEMDTRLQARRALEMDLRDGLANDQFEVHYQPLYDLRRNRICGFEALLRWNHPTRGRVGPAEFIEIAEEMNLIVPLGKWVLRQACAEACRWPSHVKVAVNVSSAQFNAPGLADTIRDVLASSGLAPQRLELEITETVLLANSASTLDTLHLVRKMGVRIAMDDFGTGYSSLSYLRSFPFDKLKVDQSFIRDLTTSSDSVIIVRAMIGLSTSLGMSTTAEGVETAEQLALLRAEACNEAQGYYFSRPVPAAGIPALLQHWNDQATVAA